MIVIGKPGLQWGIPGVESYKTFRILVEGEGEGVPSSFVPALHSTLWRGQFYFPTASVPHPGAIRDSGMLCRLTVSLATSLAS